MDKIAQSKFDWWDKQPKEYNYSEITMFMFRAWYKDCDPCRMRQVLPVRISLGECIWIPSNIKIHYDK